MEILLTFIHVLRKKGGDMKFLFLIKIVLIFVVTACSPPDEEDGASDELSEKPKETYTTKETSQIPGLAEAPPVPVNPPQTSSNTGANNTGVNSNAGTGNTGAGNAAATNAGSTNNAPPPAAPPVQNTLVGQMTVFKFLDKEGRRSFVGFQERLPNGQIALWLNDNDMSFWRDGFLTVFKDFSSHVRTAVNDMVKYSSSEESLVRLVCQGNQTLEEKKQAFFNYALQVGTIVLVDPNTAAVTTYLGKHILEKGSAYQHYGVSEVTLVDGLVVEFILIHTRDNTAPLVIAERVVEELDLDELRGLDRVNLTNYLRVLERVKGANFDFPVCGASGAAS